MTKHKLIAQQHLMGCGVACTASLLGISYNDAFKFFNKKHAFTRGYYLKDIILALKKRKINYAGAKLSGKNKKYLNLPGTIVFIKRSKLYPHGHYLLKTKKGWKNPWINFPEIGPAKAGFNNKLPGKTQWILYKK